MSDKAKYAWAQVIVVVLWLHWAWGYLWLCGVWLVPLVISVTTPVLAYPPLAIILGVLTFVIPTLPLACVLAAVAMLTYKVLGIWHLWSDTSSLQK